MTKLPILRRSQRWVLQRQLPRETYPLFLVGLPCHEPRLACREIRLVDACESGFDEREQVGIDDVGLRRGHAVRVVFVCL